MDSTYASVIGILISYGLRSLFRRLRKKELGIEYKASAEQLDKILKTVCAYGNNYCDNDIQYLFIGVAEENSEDNKAIPVLPVSGISPGRLEKCKNILNSLRSFIYPNVAFEVLANRHGEVNYLLIVVLRQTGGPFAVAPKAETDKKMALLQRIVDLTKS